MRKPTPKQRFIQRPSLWHFLISIITRACIYAALALPYRLRVRVFGTLFSSLLGPLTQRMADAKENLRSIYPDKDPKWIHAIAHASVDNIGRTVIELFSTKAFRKRAKNWSLSGPGVQALEEARKQGRAVVLVSGHCANFSAVGTYLAQHGFCVKVLSRPLSNPFLNDFFINSIASLGHGVVQRGQAGFREMSRHLKRRGVILILADQYMHEGELIDFLGKPTKTTLSAAKIALKYDALFLPNYAIRSANGIDFDLIIEEPISAAEPLDMMRAFNDSLSRQVRAHPEQWSWIHLRWKPHRDARVLAAKIGPKSGS